MPASARLPHDADTGAIWYQSNLYTPLVSTTFRDLQTPTGVMRTHVYAPAGPSAERRYPGLILYPEIFQQTGPIVRLSRQFASEGYVVMAPEIYHQHEPPGTVLGYDDAGKDKGNEYKKSTQMTTFDEDAGVVLEALREHPQCNGLLGAVGFCIGGHLAVRAALRPDILATCAFYPTDLHSGTIGVGESADTLQRIGETRGELVTIFGRQDPHVPDAGRLLIHQSFTAAKVRFEWH